MHFELWYNMISYHLCCIRIVDVLGAICGMIGMHLFNVKLMFVPLVTQILMLLVGIYVINYDEIQSKVHKNGPVDVFAIIVHCLVITLFYFNWRIVCSFVNLR